ncbi:hypothetical protein [Qiania dongpingensis]|uniref:DUF5050 domain-containing protein n=1 Tax=Qiania dongpingensis TaxID=2763669 RepID=A0A7G9G7H4_9FIRM|nr:hypothetical protein [Qiania dongpingensis]QNM06756.1 hypothetical protein H9Q78_06475 [Qiania dongpingensis]
MKLKKYLFSIMVASLLFSISCAKTEKSTNQAEGSQEEPLISDRSICVAEKGVLLSGAGGMLQFYDYQADTTYPLCARPNCTHESDDCTANLFRNGAAFPVIYRDRLYYIRSAIEEKPVTFCQADVTGEQEKELAILGDVQLTASRMLYYGEKAYFSVIQVETEEYGGAVEVLKQSTSILSIDLEDGKIEVLLRKEYGTDESLFYDLLYIYEDQMYLDLMGVQDLSQNTYFVMRLDTGEVTQLEDGAGVSLTDWSHGKVVCQRGGTDQDNKEVEGRFSIWDLKTGEKKQVGSFIGGPMAILKDGLVYVNWEEGFKEGEWKYYKFDSGETETFLKIQDGIMNFNPQNSFNKDGKEMIVGHRTVVKDGKSVDGWYTISTEDFLERKENYKFLCWSKE